MGIFRNLLVAFILMGVITRVVFWFMKKWIENEMALYITFVGTLVVFLPPIAHLFGFDVAFFEYGLSLLIWFLLDLMRVEKKRSS